MGYLIDTGIWIDVERGRIAPADIHSITKQERIFVSPVNLAEIRFGIELMDDAQKKQRALTLLRRIRRKPLLRIGEDTAEQFAVIAARLARTSRGGDFRVQDLWLAAQAIERDLTLLTSNPKDFKDIPGLRWTAINP